MKRRINRIEKISDSNRKDEQLIDIYKVMNENTYFLTKFQNLIMSNATFQLLYKLIIGITQYIQPIFCDVS